MTNPDAVRLYQGLKKQNILFQIKWADNDSDPSLLKFVLNNFTIYSSNKYIDLHYQCDNETISLKALIELANEK